MNNNHKIHKENILNYSVHKEGCLCCDAERLAVNTGSEMEAKQYEYNIGKKFSHKEHDGSAGEEMDMQKMSHKDHEAAMTNPEMAKEMEADMKKRFFIAFALTIPVFLYSPLAMKFFNIPEPSFISINFLLFLLTTPIVFWVGSIFIVGAYHSLKNRTLNMSVLISVGVLAAYLFSLPITFYIGGETFFEAAAMLVTFVLFGHWMEMKSRRGTSDSLRALFDLVPPKAVVIRDGKEVEVLTSEIRLNDIVLVKPGDKIPVDGTIVEGESTIDESLVTGESVPVFKKSGDSVIGGSINKTGSVKFKVTQIGSDTALAQIIKMVEKAQNSKAPGQRIADKAAAYLVILAVGAGIATFFAWYFGAGATLIVALTFAISAVVIACPDALGLATPTAVAVGTGIGARHNILIKDAATLERASKIEAVLLDKTGTVTEGRLAVDKIIALGAMTEKELLYFSGGAQKLSGHPFSEAIVKEVKRKKIDLPNDVEKFEAIGGLGVKAFVDGRAILVGTERLLEREGVDISPVKKEVRELLKSGKTVSLVSLDGEAVGILAVSDEIKKSAKDAIKGFKELGIEVAMITGDHGEIAEIVAREIGIDRVFANVLPSEKADYVKKMQSEGKFTAMVGDGINDAPALAQADIGIAIGAGTDVAIETADIVLMKSDPVDILKAIMLSKATVRKMKQNLFWAAIYNVLAIPVAAGLFYTSLGWSLRPEISALLMSASSIIVAVNAVFLKRIEIKLAKI